MAYDSITRISRMLDQFADGLQTMGLLKLIRSFPDVFLPLFVYTGNVSPVEVADAIFVDRDLSADQQKAMAHLHQYIGKASQKGY